MASNATSWAKSLGVGVFVGLSLLVAPRAAHAQGAPNLGGKPYTYDYLFPFWGKKLASRGISFPRPFGVGINYAYVQQGVDITGVNIALNDGKYTDLSKIVKFDHVTSTVKVINGRFD